MSVWPPFQMVFFDCDSTLSAIEGVDELAKSRGLSDEVKCLTDAAMDGEVHLESVYDKRLQLLRPTRGEIRNVEQMYRETLVPDTRTVIQALLFLQKQVYIVSGGLYEAVRPFGEWLGVPTEHICAVKVEYDRLSGEWWNYHQDRWGERLDVNYLQHDDGPLVQSTGKPDVVRRLKGTRPGRSMLVGDGVSDLAAQPVVDKFVGFGGVVTRIKVQQGADIFISANTLAPVLVLATSIGERERLYQTSFKTVVNKGLQIVESNDLSFKNEYWRQSILNG